MAIQELDPLELGRQLRQPEGEIGKQVGETMNVTNSTMYALAFGFMQLSDESRLLEIGFGNGNHLNHYLKLKPDLSIYGIDFSETMYAEAVKRNEELIKLGKISLCCGNANNMKFENNFFDYIVTLNTIYFWEPREKQIKEIFRVLKPGGKLLIGFRPQSFMENLTFTQEVFDFFEMKDVRNLLLQNGFSVLREESREVNRTTIDGKNVTAVDACILAEKIILSAN